MDRIPILKMGAFLLVTIQVDMHDQLAMQLQDDLTSRIVAAKARGESEQLAHAYAEAARGIRKRLASLHLLTGDPAQLDPRRVMEQLGSMNGSDYARASAEAAALVGWLSRLADALVKDDRQPEARP